MIDIEKFIEDQLAAWPMAQANFEALKNVQTKKAGWAQVQFNPARIRSTGAKVDAKSLQERPCFLCASNRPAEQQKIEWGDYEILVNPFPIFPRHLTIPLKHHQPQRIKGRIGDMCRLAAELPGYVVFYNGPKCGASAPDHFHFQAGNADFLPNYDKDAPFGKIAIIAAHAEDVEKMFDQIYQRLSKLKEDEEEPMMNVLCRYDDGMYHLTVIPRKAHRPSFYGSEKGQMLISPASVDLAGVMITPVEKDFNAIDAKKLQQVYSELCYTPAQLAEFI